MSPPPEALISILFPTGFNVTFVPPVIVTAPVSVLNEDTPAAEPPGSVETLTCLVRLSVPSDISIKSSLSGMGFTGYENITAIFLLIFYFSCVLAPY